MKALKNPNDQAKEYGKGYTDKIKLKRKWFILWIAIEPHNFITTAWVLEYMNKIFQFGFGYD